MKTFFKQAGKAVCYLLLFLGMQISISFIFQFVYGFKLGIQIGVSGEVFDAQKVTEQITNFIYSNVMTITLIANSLTLLFAWLFFKIRRKKLFVEANIVPFSKRYVPMLIGLGLSAGVFISYAMTFLPAEMLEAYMQSVNQTIGGTISVPLLIVDLFAAPIVEEVIFRGLILSRLRKALPAVWAVVLSSLAFGVVHGQILWILYAFVLGCLFSVIAIKTDSVLASMLTHMMFNAAGLLVPTLLGEVSTVACIILVAVTGIISAAAFWVLWKQTKEKAQEEPLQAVNE